MGKFQSYIAFISVSILAISFLSGFVFAEETTQNLSVTLKKEIELGNELKFDLFLRSSISFILPEKIKAGENATWEFGLNPASIMIFLEIPSINKTYVTETEVPLEDMKSIAIFDGVSLIFDLSPSVSFSVTGPATLNQTNFAWENFLDKQTFETPVFLNASDKDELTIDADFYLNTQISVYVQLQNYTLEIVNYPIPQLEMSPRITHSVKIEPTATIIDTPKNLTYLLIGALAIALTVIALLIIRKIKSKKAKKETPVLTPKQYEQTEVIKPEKPLETSGSTVYCIYCGEQLPTEATYCRKCGKKIK